jgi:hypothetical protein
MLGETDREKDRQTILKNNKKVTIKASRARNPSSFAKIIKTTTNNK